MLADRVRALIVEHALDWQHSSNYKMNYKNSNIPVVLCPPPARHRRQSQESDGRARGLPATGRRGGE